MIENLALFITNFHFLRPHLLILLAVLLFVYFIQNKTGGSFSNWEKVCDANLLKYLLIKANNGGRKLNRFLFMATLCLSIIAAAGPTWKEEMRPTLNPQNPLIFLLNLSSDMDQTDVTPNRLERAKIEISEILDSIPDVDSGLIVYSSEPFLISPLSNDPSLVTGLLDSISQDIMPANGDRPDRAIAFAAERIRNAGFTNGNIVILSAEAGTNENLTVEAAKKAASENIKVNVIGISNNSNQALQKTADAGEGIYRRLSTNSAQQIADHIRHSLSTKLEEDKNIAGQWLDFGYYIMFSAILSFLFLFRRGIFIFVLFYIFSTSTASAGFIWSDDHLAEDLFNAGRYGEAAEKFSNPQWQGSALYKAGNYEAAEKAFAQGNSVEDIYNKGNALAKGGKIEEAVSAYEEVLKQDPNHEDAKFNLEYLKQQQKQQQNQQNSENKENQENDNQQEQNSQSQSDQNQNQNSEKQENSQSTENENQDKESDDNGENQDNKTQNDEYEAQNLPSPSPDHPTEENEQQETAPAAMESRDADTKYDEEVQAREQRFRDIPEDKGGLLRAFIRREYNKNRYGE